ncbi:universal stress protein [Kineococcus gynurae]|uniref:Universal stress protein n=1 Tax=Kineococcus gynurae TaxID=452979 RepID=A0ABV5LRS7_9ACTN
MSGSTFRVTVGFSGSGASRRALRWALHDAAEHGGDVHVVAVDPPHPGGPAGPLSPLSPSQSLAAHLPEEIEHLAGRAPTVRTTTLTGTPATALLLAAADSDALVLGCGRKVSPVGPGTGHVVRDCVPNAPVPLVLVGPQAVVGASRRLLVVTSEDDAGERWALHRAQEARLPVRVLTTWVQNPLLALATDQDRPLHRDQAQARHHRACETLAPVARRSVQADVVEAYLRDVLAHRVGVGDLVVLGSAEAHEVPLRTLRAPVLLVPPVRRTVDLTALERESSFSGMVGSGR